MKNKLSSFVSRTAALAILSSPILVAPAQAQEVYSQVVGAIAVSIPESSDVVVTPAFARSAVYRGNLSAATNGGSATFDGASFTADEYASGYQLMVEEGSLAGRTFDITANTATAVTVSDAGNELSAAADARASILPKITLDYMFPDGVGGISEQNPGDPQILVFFNDNSQSTDGLFPEAFYYYWGDAWRKVGASFNPDDPDADFGSAEVELGEGVVVRNNGDATVTFHLYGEVMTGNVQVPVVSKSGSRVSNMLGLPRPLGLTVGEIGLAGSSAFTTTTDSSDVKDILQVFDNGSAEKNLSPTAEYYYFNGAWRKVGSANTEAFDDAVIPAAAAIVISKAPSSDQTVFWSSTWDTQGLGI